MKKVISFALVLMLVLSMIGMVAATETPSNASTPTGSITINGASEANTYGIFQMLILESYNTTSGAYSYKVHSDWTDFFARDDVKTNYMAVDNTGYVTWIGGEGDVGAANTAAFAKMALQYAKDNDLSPLKHTADEDGDYEYVNGALVFDDLPLGYYLVDSTMGALCGLTTTNPNASINAKNGSPTIDKQVQEDSTEQWGDGNTADIGQTVNFRVTINVHAGAENYVLHDQMTAGLTFQGVTKIEHIQPATSTTTETPANYYEVVTEGLTEGCTFEVRFTQAFCDHLETNDKIVVYYSAMLNRNAIVSGEGNGNEAWLEYGEGHFTTHDSSITKTYAFDIVKTDSQNALIDGAEFKIYDAANGGNEVAVVLMDDGVTYRRARADETGVSIVVKNGQVRVVGFDNGTYYLEETKSPDGYNKLTARQKFIISDGNLDATFNGGTFSTGSGVHVVNKTGTMLPETGGIGTVLFITFGMIVVIGTGLLLVTKKRMSMIED